MKWQKSGYLFCYLPGLRLILSIGFIMVYPSTCYMRGVYDGSSFLPRMQTKYPSQTYFSLFLLAHRSTNEDEKESLLDFQLTSRRELLASVGSAIMLGSAYFCLAPQSSPLTHVRLGQPILTESVLLNFLPLKGKRASVLRKIQFEIEKLSILRTFIMKRNIGTSEKAVSVHIPQYMWNQVARIGIKAVSLLEESINDLKLVLREMDNANIHANRAAWGKQQYNQVHQALQCIVTAANNKNETEVMRSQMVALYSLGCLGELLVPVFPFMVSTELQHESIPHLHGRAVVDVAIRKEMSPECSETVLTGENNSNDAFASKVIGNLTLVVDGFSSPVNAGNFIDLCQRGFFDNLPLKFTTSKPVSSTFNDTLPIVVGGTFRNGFINPLTGKRRTVPLEIRRSVPMKGDMPFYGIARNTWGFPINHAAVQSFRIPGAIATYHDPGKVNGGSSEFFWLMEESMDSDGIFMIPKAEVLDNSYSIFAYVVLDTEQVGVGFSIYAANGYIKLPVDLLSNLEKFL